MEMHDGVGLSGKPFSDLNTSVWQPKVVVMEHTNSIAFGLLGTEIGLSRPRLQVSASETSNVEAVVEIIDCLQARTVRASINDNYLDTRFLLIDNRLERNRKPPRSVMRRNDYR
jgi:hypothetical protein